MHETLRQLLEHAPVPLDGAWGSQLQTLGLPPGDCPDAWNLTQPTKVEAVARAYVEAGARVILTNTFGASRFMLARHDLAAETVAINRTGAELSLRAAAGRARVFGSLGPTGKMLLMGDVTVDELRADFAEQAEVLVAAGVDGLVIETMTDLEEARAAITAARATGLPVAACMVFDSGAEHDRTMMGVTIEQATATLAAAGADVVGSNCGQGIAGFVQVCRRMRAVTDLPLWIKANAGLPQMQGGKAVYTTTPAEFAAEVPRLLEAGASFIGGCCGTDPAFVRAVCERLGSPAG